MRRWRGTRAARSIALTRPGDTASQAFARDGGRGWAGTPTSDSRNRLDAAIIFAPAGELVPKALGAVAKGGVVVCAGIHMSEIPAFSYDLLWGERSVRSVANLTRRDGDRVLALAARVPVHTMVETRPLEQANEALMQLRQGKVQGSLALTIASAQQSRPGRDALDQRHFRSFKLCCW